MNDTDRRHSQNDSQGSGRATVSVTSVINWQNELKGERAYISSQPRDTTHPGRLRQQELETAGHITPTVRRRRAMNARSDGSLLSVLARTQA